MCVSCSRREGRSGRAGEVERTEVELRWDWGDPGGRQGFLKGA